MVQRGIESIDAMSQYRATRVYFPHGWEPQVSVNGIFHSIGKAIFQNPDFAIHFARLWNDGMPGECEHFALQYSNQEDI